MGKPKHGKESARTKSCVKYKSEGRRAFNKSKKAAKIAAGKKVRSRKMKRTQLMKWDNLIRSIPHSKPYVDTNGIVHWGVDDKGGKEKLQSMKKKGKSKKSDNQNNVVSTQTAAVKIYQVY